MANPLLVRALPASLADRGQAIEVVEEISFFKRLAGIVEADLGALPAEKIPPRWRESPVTIDLQFGWADARERLPQLSGTLEARIDAVCQRCLEPCEVRLGQTVRLLLAGEEIAGASDDGAELWELDEEMIRPLDVVEELLIMALPMAAKHASMDDCSNPVVQTIPMATDNVKPFADLKARIDEKT